MTKLSKPVTRESAYLDRGVPVIVTLHPKHLEIHVKGERHKYAISYESCLWMAMHCDAEEQRRYAAGRAEGEAMSAATEGTKPAAKPRLVQCLCGPNRHCLLAMPYEPGVTVGANDTVLTEANAAEFVQQEIDERIARKALDPWCGICRASRKCWFLEDRALAFDSLAEAMPFLEQSARDQRATAQFLKGGAQ